MTFEEFEQIETNDSDKIIALVATHFNLNPTTIHWNGPEGIELIKYYKALVDRNNDLARKEQQIYEEALMRQQQQG